MWTLSFFILFFYMYVFSILERYLQETSIPTKKTSTNNLLLQFNDSADI